MTDGTDPELPTLPTRVTVIDLRGNLAHRACEVCGESADVYVFVTDEQAEERIGEEIPSTSWPVNSFLCLEHFKDAPRVESLEDHPALE